MIPFPFGKIDIELLEGDIQTRIVPNRRKLPKGKADQGPKSKSRQFQM